jgi:uncharacterized membrane protein
MNLIPEWAPNIHPMLVHFPVAILAIAIFFDFVSFFLPKEKKWWTEEATAFLYAVGAAIAVGVYFTGKAAADSVFLEAEAQSVLTTHADWAFYTVWFYGIYAIARLLATWKGRQEHRLRYHIGFFALSLVGLFMLFQTGDNGAKMVFKYGVGVQAVEIENPVQHDHDTDHDKESTPSNITTSFNTMGNGNWTWEIEENAVSALQENFHWLTSSLGAANANVEKANDGSYALSFSGDNLNGFFVGHQDYEKVQVDYYLNMSALKGIVNMTYNVQDKDNYDFVSIASDGTVKQGRMANGEAEIFEEGTTDVSKALFVRVVGNGTHFRGYIDKKMVVHGHGDAPEAGSVGLKMEGSGTLLIKKMSMTQL